MINNDQIEGIREIKGEKIQTNNTIYFYAFDEVIINNH